MYKVKCKNVVKVIPNITASKRLVIVAQKIEQKLNDGRFSENTINSIDGFIWSEQPEGYAFWAMADTIFTVNWNKKINPVKLNEKHTAEVTKDGIKVGCQEFTHEAIERLYEASRKVNEV